MPEFKFEIGDFVRSKNGALVGIVQERVYHEHPAGVNVKYYVYGTATCKNVQFGGNKLFELLEDVLEAAVEPDDSAADWKPTKPANQ